MKAPNASVELSVTVSDASRVSDGFPSLDLLVSTRSAKSTWVPLVSVVTKRAGVCEGTGSGLTSGWGSFRVFEQERDGLLGGGVKVTGRGVAANVGEGSTFVPGAREPASALMPGEIVVSSRTVI